MSNKVELSKIILDKKEYLAGFHYPEEYVFKAHKGLTAGIVQEISGKKEEPWWLLKQRLAAFKLYEQSSLPSWMPDLGALDFSSLYYYLQPTSKEVQTWEDLPVSIKKTYARLGLPEAEKNYLAGVKAQYESEIVYGSLRASLQKQGVLFMGMEEGFKKYPELVRKYFGTVVPASDNKFAALNTAVWSGGSFIYIPKGRKVELPLHSYFRLNAANLGQFERTLIIADEGSQVHYLEGCTAPIYATASLHAAVVEIVVKKGARVRYTTIQNWSKNVYNLVTKRALVDEGGFLEWVDCNLGARLNLKYPSIYLMGPKARGEVLSLSYAGSGQCHDVGAKIIHGASETKAKVVSKAISSGTGRNTYRGLVKVETSATGCKTQVTCEALLLNDTSVADTYPKIEVANPTAMVAHEAAVSKIEEDTLFYLMTRGLTADEAVTLVVLGFIEPLVQALPVEYGAELTRLMQLEVGSAVG